MRTRTKTKVRVVLTSLAGLVVLLGFCRLARAKRPPQPPAPEARYHLILIPEVAGQITNSGVVLSESSLIEPARDEHGNPVWDSDGDGMADSYTTTYLTLGGYLMAHAYSVNDESGLAVGEAWDGVDWKPVLW